MKLSIGQIAVIESSLEYCGVKYEDIKLELTDHIASEIEEVMETNTLSFEENLKIIFDKWSSALKPSYSFFIGLRNSYPKIVLDKKVLVVKKELFIGLLISLTFLFAFLGLTRYYSAQLVTYYFQIGISILFVIGYLFLIGSTVRIWKSKLKTSFNYFSKEIVVAFICFIPPICFFTTPQTIANQALLFVFLPLVLFYVVLSCKKVMLHIQFEKKLVNL